MGDGNNDVGRKSPNPQSLSAEDLRRQDWPRPKVSNAMSQQRGDSSRGNQSAPQKFVQLVGCRDPKARPEPWVRPRAAANPDALGSEIRLLNEFTALLNRAVGGTPRHDRHR